MKKSTILLLATLAILVLVYLLPHWITITLAIIAVSVNMFIFGGIFWCALLVANPDLFKACRENNTLRTHCEKIDGYVSKLYPGFEKKKLELVEKLKKEQQTTC